MKPRHAVVVVLLMVLALRVSGDGSTPAQTTSSTDKPASTQATNEATANMTQKVQAEAATVEKPGPQRSSHPAPNPRNEKPPAAAPKPETPPPATAADVAAAKHAADLAANAANAAAGSAAAASKSVEQLAGKLSTESQVFRGLLVATGLLAFAAVALLSIPLLRAKPQPQPEENPTARRLTSAADKLDAALQFVEDKLQKTSHAIGAKLAAANVVTADQLTPIQGDLGNLREEIMRIRAEVEDVATRPPSVSQTADQVALERQVLGEWWKLFVANHELNSAVESAERESTWMPLIAELAKVVPADLRSTFDAVVAPCREHWSLLQKIKIVPRVAEGKAGDMASAAEEVRRTREYAGLLQSAQSGSDVANRLTFRFKNWVTDSFLPFADQYLQRYQQARLEKRQYELEAGATLVRQLLRIAAVEPIDVTPGETTFDSTRHIGRSTTFDQRFADGVITGVVRNGFIEGGQQVIRQPEVIVNRTRS